MSRTVSLAAYVALWVFSLALALIEAAVVVYLRALTGNPLFPLHNTLTSLGPALQSLEVWREVATLVVLLVPAYLLQVPALLRVAAYILVFALWDLAYYGFLRLFIGWPVSFANYDVLFLIPKPWISPVVCPVMVAATMALGATSYLYLARNRVARAPGIIELLALAVGAGIILLSFTWDTSYFLAGGLPPRFPWLLFLSGYTIALLGGAHLLFQFARQEKARFF